MALERTTTWICDVCGKKEIVESNDHLKGLNTPSGWDEKIISMSRSQNKVYEIYVLMCGACIDDFQKLYSFKEESKAPLKKPFW